jgi:hypothetical protein
MYYPEKYDVNKSMIRHYHNKLWASLKNIRMGFGNSLDFYVINRYAKYMWHYAEKIEGEFKK